MLYCMEWANSIRFWVSVLPAHTNLLSQPCLCLYSRSHSLACLSLYVVVSSPDPTLYEGKRLGTFIGMVVYSWSCTHHYVMYLASDHYHYSKYQGTVRRITQLTERLYEWREGEHPTAVKGWYTVVYCSRILPSLLLYTLANRCSLLLFC